MKKIFALSIITMLAFCTYASARVQYDSTGRNVIQDNTIRGKQRRATVERNQQTQAPRIRGAAAARINYDNTNADWVNRHTYKTFKPVPNYYYKEEK